MFFELELRSLMVQSDPSTFFPRNIIGILALLYNFLNILPPFHTGINKGGFDLSFSLGFGLLVRLN